MGRPDHRQREPRRQHHLQRRDLHARRAPACCSGRNDSFGFTWQTLSGDGEIIARVNALQNTGTSSRVGVMIRDTLATNSRHVFMGLTGTGAYRWVRRTSLNGNTSTSNSSTGTVPNTWVRLVRSRQHDHRLQEHQRHRRGPRSAA